VFSSNFGKVSLTQEFVSAQSKMRSGHDVSHVPKFLLKPWSGVSSVIELSEKVRNGSEQIEQVSKSFGKKDESSMGLLLKKSVRDMNKIFEEWTGKTAHVQCLSDKLFLRQFVLSCRDLFDN